MSVATVPFQMTEICRKVITLYVFSLKIEVEESKISKNSHYAFTFEVK